MNVCGRRTPLDEASWPFSFKVTFKPDVACTLALRVQISPVKPCDAQGAPTNWISRWQAAFDCPESNRACSLPVCRPNPLRSSTGSTCSSASTIGRDSPTHSSLCACLFCSTAAGSEGHCVRVVTNKKEHQT
eukprot:102761-Amphidinium_carterae.1